MVLPGLDGVITPKHETPTTTWSKSIRSTGEVVGGAGDGGDRRQQVTIVDGEVEIQCDGSKIDI